MFFTKKEEEISKDFINNGFIIGKVSNVKALEKIRAVFLHASENYLKLKKLNNDFLGLTHKYISPNELNEYRLDCINQINKNKDFKKNYFNLAKKELEIIVGNELAMQLRINLSIQLPNDDSSLLPLHADTWSGDSPFEVVLWIPLVDCFKTKSMFILSPKETILLHKKFNEFSNKNSEDLYNNIEKKLNWIDIKYGEFLILNQTLPHDNRVNRESETRWSMNCRFKSVFSPYGDKKNGEFFEPVTLRAASKLAMQYRLPDVK